MSILSIRLNQSMTRIQKSLNNPVSVALPQLSVLALLA